MSDQILKINFVDEPELTNLEVLARDFLLEAYSIQKENNELKKSIDLAAITALQTAADRMVELIEDVMPNDPDAVSVIENYQRTRVRL